MEHYKTSLSAKNFDVIFPFHLVWNENFELVQIGRSLLRILPMIQVGENLQAHFELISPKIGFTKKEFQEQLATPYSFKSIFIPKLILRGQVMLETVHFVFIGFPVIQIIKDINNLNLNFKDFPDYNSITAHVFLLNDKENSLKELNDMNCKLLEAKKELETSNLDLEAKVRLRTLNLQKVNKELIIWKEQAERSLDNLTETQNELKASYQQLMADEQQLEATNQQLRAGERQLRVANEKMLEEISERKKAENTISASETKYRTIFDSSRDAIMMIAPPSWKFTTGNPAALSLFGAANETEFTIREPWEMSPERQPDGEFSSSKAKKMIKIAMEEGTNFFEWNHKKLNGDVFPATILLSKIELEGKQLLQATVRDITKQKKAEEEIKSLAKFSSENPSPVLRIAKDGTVLYGNKEGLSILSDLDCKVGECTPDQWRQLVGEVLASGLKRNLEIKHGDKIYLFEVIPLVDDSYVNLYGFDITERKKAEAKVRLQSSALEASANAIVITNNEGTIEWINPAFTIATGYTSEEALGKNPRILKSGKHNIKFYRDLWTTIKSGKIWRGEMINRRKDGTFYTEEQTITSVKNEQGEIIRFIAVKQDITERKKVEEALRESEELFRTVVYTAGSIIFYLSPDGMILELNPEAERFYGYKREDVLGKNYLELFVPEDIRSDIIADMKKVLAGKATRNFENLVKVRDGSEYTIMWNADRVLDSQGKSNGIIAIGQDITERKKAEEIIHQSKEELEKKVKKRTIELQREKQKAEIAEKAKSSFLANMSHEIRTPMNAIVGFCDLLQKTSLNKTQKDYIDVLQSSGQLLCSVVNGVLDFSRLESGERALEAIDFNLRYVLNDTLEMALARTNSKLIKTYIDIDENVPVSLNGDPTKLRQVLINLLSNALKFTSEGEIGVIVKKEQENPDKGILLRFTVKDTGVGISQDSLEHIFEPFHQADSSITRKYGGTGLGLSISKSFVEVMGGKIWAKSKENEGSEFNFTVKLKKGASVVQKEVYPLEIKDVAGLKVLIVDDNQISREILKKLCESLKMEILAVEHSGFVVLKDLKKLTEQKNLPDLILSDIRMEGMSGFELVEKIRANKRYAKIKIITVSSEAYAGQAHKAREKGFDGYLPKPFNNSELIRVITTVLGDKRKGGQIVTRHMAKELGCKGIRVLFVEDNKPNRMLMQEYSKELGCESEFAEDGQQAINKLKEGKNYNVILMDLHMPVLGGVEATVIIRKEISRDIPIIALTAAVLEEDRKSAEAAGMNDFLTKPIDFNDMREKIIKYGRKA